MSDSCTHHPMTIFGISAFRHFGGTYLPAKLDRQKLTPQVFLLTWCRQRIGALANVCLNACASRIPNNLTPTKRLYAIGCMWGFVLVMLWKAMAGFEGVLATRRLGYGCWWLPMSALGLALTWQARICFHHSCESDLFQVRPLLEVFLCPSLALDTQRRACSVPPS